MRPRSKRRKICDEMEISESESNKKKEEKLNLLQKSNEKDD